MRLIERYLFRQMLAPTILATVALTVVALLSQSLSTLDLIINQRQNAAVFAQVTLLAMPQLLTMMLPVAIFVAALVALNRLHTEQEIVVCFASGMNRWRVISPPIRLAVGAALLALFINLWVQPACAHRMRSILFDVRTDLASTLVSPGEFTEPAPGLNVYAQSVDRERIIHNLFIHLEKPGGGADTYTAEEGRIGKRDGSPVLVMTRGSNQTFSREGVLNYLSFEEYVFELKSFVSQNELIRYKPSDRYLHELLFPDLRGGWEVLNREKLLAEGHSRLSAPLYNIAFMAIALAAVLGGQFSRLGYGRRIAAAAAAAAVVRILGFSIQAACASNEWLNIGQYLVPLAAMFFAHRAIFRQRVSRYIGLAHRDDGAVTAMTGVRS